jgi:hypothetical protein
LTIRLTKELVLMASNFLSNIFQKRPTASGDIGYKLIYFARNIQKNDYYFGNQAYKVSLKF